MSSPPSFAASPPPISAVAYTFGLNLVDEYLAITAICTVFILYFIVFSYYKTRINDELESGNAAAGALLVPREREMVQIEASVFSYKDARESDNDECAICLNEFKEGQKCRMMKKCGHIFHRSCIDRWLKVERHCPLCRTSVCIIVQP